MRLTFQKTARLCLFAGAIALPMTPLSIQAQQPGQPTTPGQPATHELPGQLTSEQFIAHPDQLLEKFPTGGAVMITQVRELTLANHANLPYLLDVLARANHDQGIAIGTALGQAAIASVKSDPAFATAIQHAVAEKSLGRAAGAGSNDGGGSTQPKIGSTVTTVDQVEGETEKGVQTITTGTAVYAEEVVRTGVSGKAQMLLADRTNLAVAPMTTIRLDKYVYDPSGGGQGNVVLVATSGAFRFITGQLPHEDYQIKTPVATMGIRGTQFIVVVCDSAAAARTGCGIQLQVISGAVVANTISGRSVTLTAGELVSVDSQGNPSPITRVVDPIVNFADLGPALTNLSYADALDAFSAVAGDVSIGATDVVGGGGGGSDAPLGGGGGGGGIVVPPTVPSATPPPTTFGTFGPPTPPTGFPVSPQ